MTAWLFLFSLNTFETEKDQVITFATTDCLWSAECLFNVLAFHLLHSLPVMTMLFLCFTHNLQVIKWVLIQSEVIHTDPYSFDHICWKLRTVKLYWQTVLFDFWGFWFVVLCGNWEAVELAIYNLLFQSETFFWCRALIEIKFAFFHLVSHC